MPELPEVETVCLALSKIVNNSKVRNVKIIRNRVMDFRNV